MFEQGDLILMKELVLVSDLFKCRGDGITSNLVIFDHFTHEYTGRVFFYEPQLQKKELIFVPRDKIIYLSDSFLEIRVDFEKVNWGQLSKTDLTTLPWVAQYFLEQDLHSFLTNPHLPVRLFAQKQLKL